MNQQQAIDLAERAGVSVRGHYDETGSTPAELARLIKLVREETIRECVAVCEQEQVHWQMQAPGAADGRYDWKADGAEACAEELRGLLERDV